MATKGKELSELGSILSVSANTANIDGSLIVANSVTIGNSTVNTTFTATSINANTVGGNTASDLRLYADDKAANAYSNAVTYADNKVANLVNNAPTILDTLVELSNAIGNDANFFTTVTNNVANAYTNATTFASNATNISSGTLNTARLPATVNVSTLVNVGTDVNINTSAIFIGNSSVNTIVSAATITLNGVNVNTAISGNAATAYTNAAAYADVAAGTAYANAVSYANTIAGTAYSNAATYADNKAANAYSNAIAYSANATNITSGTLTANVLPTSGVTANTYGNSSAIPVITVDATGRITSATVNAVAGVTSFAYTEANNTFVISTGAGTTFAANIGTANATHTGVLKVLDSVANTNTTIAAAVSSVKTAYDAAIAANTNAASAYSNAVSYAGTIAATAYTNATSYAATIAGTAYSNGVTYTDNKAANAYSNATTFASNASNISSGTLGEARLPYRMDQNVRTNDSVSFGSVSITGNLTVTGTTVTINTTNLTVDDNMIYLNEGAGGANANPDLGIAGAYNDGTYRHAGFFRDASDGVWKIFDQYLPEPDASPFIDTANASFRIANFQANVVTAASFSGNGASVTSVDAATVGGNTAGTLRSYSDSVAATAYTNAVSSASSSAATAYSNAVSYFTSNYTASDVLTKIKTVDGTGSGLDADTVDGYDASSFALKTDPEFTNDITTSSGQGRFGGWYVGTGYTGPAFEVGYSGGEAYALAYDRITSSYLNMNFNATDFEFTGESGGFARINTSFRAPIFYDTANTSYYLDPASTSNLNVIQALDGVFGNQGVLASGYPLTVYDSQRYLIGLRNSVADVNHPWLAHDDWNGAALIFHFNGLGDRFRFSEGGIGQADSDFRAPIFYDSANTSFYVDPGSGSNLSGTLQNNGGATMSGGWNRNLYLVSTFPVVVFNSNNSKYSGIGVDYTVSDGGFYFWVNGSSADISGTGTTAMTINTGNYVTAYGSFRAPIFYDSGNTSFYVDPASSSNIGSLTTNSGYNLQTSSASSVYTQINATDASASYAYIQLTTQSGSGYLIRNRTTGNSVTDKSLYLYNDAGPIEFVPSANISVRATLSTTGMTIAGSTVWHAGNDGSGSGLDADLLDGYSEGGFAVSQRGAEVTDNTGMNNNARRNGMYRVNNGVTAAPDSSRYYSLIQYGNESNVVGQLVSDFVTGETYIRGYNSTWSSWRRVWDSVNDGSGSGLDADLLDGQNGSYYLAWENISSGTRLDYTLKFRAPVSGYAGFQFLSSSGGDAGYFLIRGTSDTDVYTAEGITIVADAGWLTLAQRTSASKGVRIMSGTSTSTERLKITTAGDIQFVNGNSFTYGGNAIWHAGNDGSGSGLDADLLDGLNVHNTQGTQSSANQILRTQGDGYTMLGWINTPSGDSGIATRLTKIYSSYDDYIRYSSLTDFKVHMSLSAKNNYSRRIDYTSDSNYHVGSFGHGGYGANETFHGGSGFFDIWSGTNFPSGTSHIHGFNALHYTTNSLGSTGGNAYGLQVAGQYDQAGTLFTRTCNGGSFSSWHKIWSAANDGSGSGLDADLLDGLDATTAATASTIVARDSGGDVYQRYSFAVHFNQSSGNNENPTIAAFWTNSGSDNYCRKSTPAHVISQLGLATTSNLASYLPLSGGTMTGDLGFGSSWLFYDDTNRDASAAVYYPNSKTRAVRFSFANASSTGTNGNYSGVMHFHPWDGTTASTGDASYQLAFGSSGTNGSGVPILGLRKGIDTTWNSWYYLAAYGVNYKTGALYATQLIDSDSTGYYVDPSATSILANVRATSFTNDATGSVRIMFPGGGSYASTSSSVAGAIKIRLPVSWSYTMMRFTVKIYEYTTNEAFEVNCGGYNYGSGYWVNTFAYILANPGSNRNFNVRFGHDGTYCCVYIGETSDSWTYPQVTVTDFEGGYSGYGAAEWDDGWAISFETSFGTISATESNSQIGRVSSIFYDYDNTGYYIDPASTSNINAMTMAGQLNMHAGSYEGLITFGSVSSWQCGIRQHDDGDAELRIFAKNAAGMIFLATGYDGTPASISRPTDGLCIQNNNVGIGDFSASDPSYDLHVKGNIYADGGWFRVSGGNGYYWETYDTRIYSDTSDYLKTRSNLGIQHQDRSGNIKGYTYFDSAGFGMLAGNANWWLNNRAGDDASLVIGGYNGYNPYNSVTTRRILLGGGDSNAHGAYFIGTNLENVGGNYNKLDLRWHTGIRMGAQRSYGGIRFFDSEAVGTVRFQIEGTDGYLYKYVWLKTDTTGMFSDTNGAHIRPNVTTTYGQWEIIGSKNSFGGIYDSYSGVNGIMYDGGGNGGVYREANGRWFWYWSNSNLSMGIAASTTSSSYALYVTGSIYSTSNIVAASDARLKENVITVDNALDKVNQLRGVYYNRIDDEEKKRKVGVIAQEIKEVVPEVVTYDKENDKFGVDYGNLAGLFIEAIKKLTDEVNSLKKEIEVLKNGSSN